MGAGLPNVSMAPKVNASSSTRGAPAVFKFVLHDLDCSLDKPGSKYLVFTAHLSNSPRSSSVDSGCARKNPAHPPPANVPESLSRKCSSLQQEVRDFSSFALCFDWAGGFDQVMSALSENVNCF